ncbi:hypothetical protein ILYODFUR_035904 [Ilyodon furcidens]|uniref:Uncharacterized protein n=1 Tax=Ilyodon furcidens TaxID=33524 RepID=A0ABV0V8Y4_9TELE
MKLSSSMSKDSNHSLLHWTSPVGSLLNSSLLGYHSRTLSTLLLPLRQLLKTLDRLIILAHHYPPSSTSRVNNYLVSLLLHPLADHSIIPLVSRFQFPCPRVNKLFTKKLCLLNCFLHVGQIR